MPNYYLAQINIAHLKAPIDDPLIADFVADLDRINLIAEKSDGFIWRLKDDEGNATSFNPYDNPDYIINISVWQNVNALKEFVYNSGHLEVFMKRVQWFHKMNGPHMALWWVPINHMPTVEESVAKLELLKNEGPSDQVFTFRDQFDAPN